MQTKTAVIPARGGSTRLKDKNIFPLNGKPLISYTIESVIRSKIFDKIIVSTDSDLIASEAKNYDQVEIYRRDASLSDERTPVVYALLEMMNHIKKTDIFSYFLPTCPLRNSQDILSGIHHFSTGADSVICCSYYDTPPQLAMIPSEDDQIAYPLFDNLRAGLTNSKYIQKYIHPNGGYYMGYWDQIVKSGHFFNGKIKYSILPKERAIDINDIQDLKYAETLLSL